MTDDRNGQAMSWGKAFVSSILSGLAAWKVFHKLTNTEPSEWFSGLASTYAAVRDFVLTPFAWLQIDLSADERDLLTIGLVLIAAGVRTAVQYPAFRIILAIGLGIIVLSALVGDFSQGGLRMFLLVAVMALTLTIVVTPILGALIDGGAALLWSDWTRSREFPFVLMCVLSTLVWGAGLLFLNWATS